MLSYSENILRVLTGESSLSELDAEQLEQIAVAHPYFAAAQFFFAKKLYADKQPNYEAAKQKTALHFPNVLWLDYNFSEEVTIATEESKAPVANRENLLQAETVQEEILIDEHHEKKTEEPVTEYSQAEPMVAEENIIEQSAENLEEISESYPLVTDENRSDIADEPLSETDEITGDEEIESNERLSSLLKEQAAALEKPVGDATLPIEATPYHRIDYFESQGIKLEENKANDKLGTQLKRFTDWLKQMKRINPDLSNMEADPAAESRVQNLAEHSNEPKEVVTEAMAEVFIMQGKPEQAIHIYEKLSFINPPKSAYFAAKIQELKG